MIVTPPLARPEQTQELPQLSKFLATERQKNDQTGNGVALPAWKNARRNYIQGVTGGGL
jgi:hypothetical protein